MKKNVLVFAMLMMSLLSFGQQTLEEKRAELITYSKELSKKYTEMYDENRNNINYYIVNDTNGEYESSLAEIFKLQKDLNRLMIKNDYELYLLMNNFDKYLANLNKK